ncbi:MAG: Ig-like domain repeat protein [Acidobacteria bacterium]|nr:Ig-like domain repeat protein [Acidobacteriota bacterium]
MRRFIYSVALSLCAYVATPLVAQTKGVASFDGLKNMEFVNQFYNGGEGSLGSGPPRKNLHLEFTSNAQTIVSGAKGGSGNFIGNPGGTPVMFFQTGEDVIVNSTEGVSVGLWFSYSALQPGTVTVYDGANGAGKVLASVTLSANNIGCNSYRMCVWSPVGLPLKTPAGSIRFSGVANYLAIGAIHLGVKLPTSTILASSQNPSVQGQPVTFMATISATGAVPVGTVQFKSSNVVLGEVPVTGDTASLTLSSLSAGSHTIKAVFRGQGFVTSSANLLQTVNP